MASALSSRGDFRDSRTLAVSPVGGSDPDSPGTLPASRPLLLVPTVLALLAALRPTTLCATHNSNAVRDPQPRNLKRPHRTASGPNAHVPARRSQPTVTSTRSPPSRAHHSRTRSLLPRPTNPMCKEPVISNTSMMTPVPKTMTTQLVLVQAGRWLSRRLYSFNRQAPTAPAIGEKISTALMEIMGFCGLLPRLRTRRLNAAIKATTPQARR